MENRKSLIFLTLVSFLFLPLFVSAYKPETTHKGLTNDIIKLYEYNYSSKFTEEEKNSIEKGAVDEDNGTRALNHFYDPVYNKGVALTSKDWAGNTQVQAVASGSYLAGLGNATQGYFSSATDYSWDRAIYEYAHGNKNRGLESLGHILHLIEDATVPDHTRDDPHPDFVYHNMLGQESPYENFTGQFDSSNISVSKNLINEGLRPVIYSTLGEYFDKVSNYSNNNFFSKDTIFDKKYSNPQILFEKSEKLSDGINHNFGYNSINSKLIEIKKERNKSTGVINISYVFDDKDNLILTDYWNLLSRSAVLNGAGVVKLFFDEVEKEKKTLALYNKNKSWFARLKDKLKRSDFLADNPNQNVASVILATDIKKEEKNSDADIKTPTLIEVVEVRLPLEEVRLPQLPQTTIIATPAVTATTTPELPKNSIPTPFSVPYGAGFGGGGGSSLASVSIDTTPPNAPTITTPLDFSQTFTTTSLSFGGISEKDSVIKIVYTLGSVIVSATTTTNAIGVWSSDNLAFGQGTTTLEVYASDNAGNISAANEIQFFVDSLSPDTTLASVECNANSLSTSGCLVATTTLNFKWSSSAPDLDFFVVNRNGAFSTTTATGTTVIAADSSAYTFAISARDIYGNAGATTTLSIEVFSAPVVINEIAWMGTDASPNDEWIELYNRTEKEIALSNWVLYAKDGVPYIPLSGAISAGGYYLIERTNDTTVSDIAADLTLPFSGSGSGSGLGDGGENLFLVQVKNNATTTIDEVEICGINVFPQWCGGIISTFNIKYTMERFDPNIAGTEPSNWGTAIGEFILNGKDANGNLIKGTPKSKNSISYKIAKGGSLSADKTLTKKQSPYLIDRDNFTIPSGKTLTIEPGVVVKFVSPNISSLAVNGTLVTEGTASDPVVFTSFEDDTYGGDLNRNGTSTIPVAGSWGQFYFSNTSQHSSLKHTIVRYGGKWYEGMAIRAMVIVNGATVAFENVEFENTVKKGLYLENSTSTIANSTFRNNVTDYDAAGLYVAGGAPTITASTFVGNRYGLQIVGAPGLIATGNTFTNNTAGAVTVNGIVPTFSSNSGSGSVLAAIVIGDGGEITRANSTTTLAVNALPYVIRNEAKIAASSTLAFAPGVVVKGHDNQGGNGGRIVVLQGGKIFHDGTSPGDIIFTSMRDDTVGGTVSTAAIPPAASDWYGINVQSGGLLQMSGFTLRYAGGMSLYISNDKGGIRIAGGGATSTIAHALIENNFQYGVRITDGALVSVATSTLKNNTEWSVNTGISSAFYVSDSTLSLKNMTFSGNTLDVKTVGSAYSVLCDNCSSLSTDPSGLF